MEDPLVISLVVTGIGMLMLFLALAFLYGLMMLMTALIRDRPEAGGRKQEARSERQEAGSGRQRAAVIGVALARAELELKPIGGAETKVNWSPWRQFHTRRLLSMNVARRTIR